MKKKVMMTEVALQALLTPEAVVEPVVEPVVPVEPVAKTPEAEVEAKAEEVVIETVPKAELDTFKAEFEAFKVTAEGALAAAVATATELEASASDLKSIVVSQISRMRLGLKLAAVDMSGWSIKAIVEEYTATSESFIKALPVGSVIPKEANTPAAPEALNSHQMSAIKNLGF